MTSLKLPMKKKKKSNSDIILYLSFWYFKHLLYIPASSVILFTAMLHYISVEIQPVWKTTAVKFA